MSDATDITPASSAPAPADGSATGVPGNSATIGQFVGSGTVGTATPDEMKEAMKEIFDPEIPINIVDLGLIYGLNEKEGKVDVLMTLTSPHCPVADQLKSRVNEVLTKLPGIKAVQVDMTHNPPWSKDKISFEGKLQASMLGIM